MTFGACIKALGGVCKAQCKAASQWLPVSVIYRPQVWESGSDVVGGGMCEVGARGTGADAVW